MIKEFATLKAAALAGCDLCMDIGSIVAARSGVIERQLLTLQDHTTSPAVDDRERLVVDLLVGMTATPAGVADALCGRPLRQARTTDTVREHLARAGCAAASTESRATMK